MRVLVGVGHRTADGRWIIRTRGGQTHICKPREGKLNIEKGGGSMDQDISLAQVDRPRFKARGDFLTKVQDILGYDRRQVMKILAIDTLGEIMRLDDAWRALVTHKRGDRQIE